jgi:GR25 family glycosyltransferase involved in LPS biosynthesis
VSDIAKVFCINLEHRTDRRDFMEGQLARLDLDCERFSAVEPSELAPVSTGHSGMTMEARVWPRTRACL